MKIKYLGTAAYEGIPTIFCDCEICQQSLKLGGKNIRTRCQALINDDLLLDFGPDTVHHFQKYGFNFNNILDVLITHSHGDHLYINDVEIASIHFSYKNNKTCFHAAEDGYNKILNSINNESLKIKDRLEVNKVIEYKPFEIRNKYIIVPFKANHDPNSSPVFYLIKEKESGKSILYAHDTGMFFEETYPLLKKYGKISLISLDCTGALEKERDWTNNHMSIKTNLEVISRLKKEEIIDDQTTIVVNHFSHNGKATYDAMQKHCKDLGIVVSYDGLEFDL